MNAAVRVGFRCRSPQLLVLNKNASQQGEHEDCEEDEDELIMNQKKERIWNKDVRRSWR